MNELHDLEVLVRARTPIIIVETNEELRAIELFRELAGRLSSPLFRWSVTEGLQRIGQNLQAQKFNTAPADVLAHIKSSTRSGIYLLLDFHPFLSEALHIRLIREIAQEYANTPKLLVFLSHSFEVPKEIASKAAKFQLALPNHERIIQIIREVGVRWVQENPNRKVVADRLSVEALARNLRGLTATDVERLARKAIYDDGSIGQDDLPRINRAKYELIHQEGVLTFEYETARFADVGGLENMKRWLGVRKAVFHGQGAEFGLELPKGVLLLGVQGCGKSLAAKAIAGTWEVPLLRLDFATLYNKYIGETERNLRQSLKSAEVMAPCVLWIDELEKGLSGGDGDDGVSRRVLGTLLTWMAERQEAVFVVATANDVQSLPPELLRKGRFDEIFFVDLPDDVARRAILEIQLRRRKLDHAKMDLELLVSATNGFSGAEIEQAVVSSLYAAIAHKGTVTETQLLQEIRATRPLSVLMAEKVEALRAWAAVRTVPA